MKKIIYLVPTLSLVGCTSQRVEEKPNVIVILADDLGFGDVSAYGSTTIHTPNIDSLAHGGVCFMNGYATSATSTPSRYALMTGMYPWENKDAKILPGDAPLIINENQFTLPKMMQQCGYVTGAIGKWHLGDDEKYWPENQGFDVNIAGNYKGAPIKNKQGCNGYFSPYCLPRLENGKEGEYLTDRLTDEAVHLIETHGDSPFYLNLAHYAVHTPLGAKPELEKKYEALADSSYFQHNATYAAMIQSVDESLAKLLAALERKGILDNTLIIVTSDNGAVHRISGSYPLRKGKGSEYEGGVRVPLITYWKGHILPNQRNSTPVITMDLFSTVLDVACVELKDEKVDGISLLPVIKGEDLKVRPLFWHYPHYHNGGARPYSSVRLGEWKLIKQYETHTYELYNLKEDIGEKEDLSKKNPDKVNELRGILEKWLKNVDAQLPFANANWNSEKERKTGKYAGVD